MVHDCFVIIGQSWFALARAVLTTKLWSSARYEVCGPVTRVMTCRGPLVIAPLALQTVLPPTSWVSLLLLPYHISPSAVSH